jgi:hypothetical protein
MKKLIEYLKNLQPLLNINELERLVGCPDKTIHKALQNAQPLPQKWASDILKILCEKYKVVKFGSDFIEWRENIFVVWSIAEEHEPIDHDNYFEYPVSLAKGIYDEFDILEILN